MDQNKLRVSKDIPDIITDTESKKKYKKGKFLGRGGFAKCFEYEDMADKKLYACKIVAKSQLIKEKHKNKMKQEIHIHRSLSHQNVVKFYSFFEDENYVYIILELCAKRSMMEMHKRRKILTEPEIRYYTQQIALGCVYLHEKHIVHRDLKLGNLFLNEDMQVKIGDFGLASQLTKGERKQTLCGTPNYIAPEILLEAGHGYEVDVWSLGCIVYTLAVGKPPFETDDLKHTYRRIKKNEYIIPEHVSPQLTLFIKQMLQHNPSKRPTMLEIVDHPYLVDNYIPTRLPTSCLCTAPRTNDHRLSMLVSDEGRRPLTDMANAPVAAAIKTLDGNDPEKGSKDYYLTELFSQINKLFRMPRPRTMPIKDYEQEASADPASMPFFWISKWVDYTDKYGIGYQMCDNSIGVLFNDSTKLILMSDATNLHYVDDEGSEQYYKVNETPDHLAKKVTLFHYFRSYMNSNLLKMGEKQREMLGETEEMQRVPYINTWFRTNLAIIFHLTNGTLQINFFKDHVKLILCPHMGAVTLVNENGEFQTYKFTLMSEHGIKSELKTRLKFAKNIIDHLIKKP